MIWITNLVCPKDATFDEPGSPENYISWKYSVLFLPWMWEWQLCCGEAMFSEVCFSRKSLWLKALSLFLLEFLLPFMWELQQIRLCCGEAMLSEVCFSRTSLKLKALYSVLFLELLTLMWEWQQIKLGGHAFRSLFLQKIIEVDASHSMLFLEPLHHNSVEFLRAQVASW